MNPTALLAWHYGIEAADLRQIEGGTTPYTYAVNERYFFKIYDKALGITARLIEYLPHQLEALTLLKEADGLKGHLCYPLPTAEGRLYAETDEMVCVLFNLILAETVGWAHGLTARQSKPLSALLGALHRVPTAPFEALCPKESFGLAFADRLVKLVRTEQEAFPLSFRELLRCYGAAICTQVAETAARGQRLAQKKLPFVLCHTDAHGGNLMQNEAGFLWLIDWENLMLAPKEADLFAYQERADFAWFTGQEIAPPDEDALCFYDKRRDLEDIWEFLYVVRYECPGEQRLQEIFAHVDRIVKHLCGREVSPA